MEVCINYCASNEATVKDQFLIPTIDELLNELGVVRIFSNLDLWVGYHQICMYPDDIEKTAFKTHEVL